MATETLHAALSARQKQQLQLASLFSADMKNGLKIQTQVGPWIAVIGSSKPKPGEPAYETAHKIGRLIATRLKRPVATGGATGAMEGANLGAFEVGGISVGIYLEGLPTEQTQNLYCTHSIRCKTMLARQHLLLSGACALVVAPEGGFGTVFEITHQLIEMRRQSFDPDCPIAIIDELNLWHGLSRWVQAELVARGLLRQSEFDKLLFVRSADEAIAVLSARLPPTITP
jgi:uncharacterized protein (TIGR00730 family)